jgi:hypothetical protein
MSQETSSRFQLRRGGIRNVWQYDDQVFDFGGGRLLLRGANGAGKSKTLEILLPFVIDGDKAKITASGRHHTSLLWLMLDGYSGQNRTGYLWVEFARVSADGSSETLTCGIGLRASESARTATTWYFTSPRRVGVDLDLADAAGPLSMQRLRAEVEPDGHFFDPNSTRRYREHVGQLLFGLPLDEYEDLLRLLYWLRQPQIGEDIDPKRLAEQLVQALPQVDESAIRSAGDTFDQLEEFGEQIDRQERAATAITAFLQTYRSYACGVVGERARSVVEAAEVERRRRREVRRMERAIAETAEQLDDARERQRGAETEQADASARITQLKAGPEARARAQLIALDEHLTTKRRLADQAARRLAEQRRRVDAARRRAGEAGTALGGATGEWVSRARAARAESAEAGIVGALARTAHLVTPELGWQQTEAAHVLREELEPAVAELQELRDRVGVARAAVNVVDEARVRAEGLRAEATRREEDNTRAEAGLAGRQARHDEAVTSAIEAAERLAAELTAWLTAPDAVPVEPPEISGESLARFASVVTGAVAPVRSKSEQRRAEARARLSTAEADRREVSTERERVAAERDPRPPRPVWHRADRADREIAGGAPFWRLVDFRDDVEESVRSAVEAALEGSGLLDAWVTPGGQVLTTVDDAFVVADAPAPEPAAHRSSGLQLSAVLRADRRASGLVPHTVVASILGQIGLAPSVPADGGGTGESDAAGPGSTGESVFAGASATGESGPALMIGLDGSWRAGPLVGRTGKAAPQFIGATARAAERLRRLSLLDARLAVLDEVIEAARTAAAAHTSALEALDRWQHARPSHAPLLTTWATEQAAAVAVEEARAEVTATVRVAEAARAASVRAHEELVSLGQVHNLPLTAAGLRAREAMLQDILTQARDLELGQAALVRDVARWHDLAEVALAEVDGLEEAVADHERTDAETLKAAAELDELRAAAGASVAELEARLAELAQARDTAEALRTVEATRVEELVRASGTLDSEHDTARRELAEATPRLTTARDDLLALERAPGLIAAALGTIDAPADGVASGDPASAEGVAGLGASPAAYDGWTPDDPRALLVALPEGNRADDTAVVSASQALVASAAATLEPRIAKVEGAWVAFGLGEGGELSLVDLEAQLVATVRANKELLSKRERQIFEEQVLGYLGDALRGVRLKAEELVTAMNAQLDGVSTSQGIRVRLRWRQRDDIAADAKRAVELLGAPIGALLPSERVELRESLHRLIDSSRSEAPEESYAEHLARALDYRRWFAFTVQYHRPETGEWRDLQRKSALSQGEQKVLCYLPLFAAAAAHFTSVAGAAPHAPRFVLLDDAFPKIDARTHPLLFGLLVDLDLDFVVTSERLWGTHATVPELAIYEALRSPGERGIAQFEHRWDGHQLSSVGARGSAPLGVVDG